MIFYEIDRICSIAGKEIITENHGLATEVENKAQGSQCHFPWCFDLQKSRNYRRNYRGIENCNIKSKKAQSKRWWKRGENALHNIFTRWRWIKSSHSSRLSPILRMTNIVWFESHLRWVFFLTWCFFISYDGLVLFWVVLNSRRWVEFSHRF